MEIDPDVIPELESFEAHSGLIYSELETPPPSRGRDRKSLSFRGLLNRILQELARILPGAQSVRVALHRARGVNIGRNVWIGYDVALETSRPFLITLEEGCVLSMRVTVLAHFKESTGVKIERDAFVGAGALILPNVVIGQGAVVAAGSVVTRSVPPLTMVHAESGCAGGRNAEFRLGWLYDFEKDFSTFDRPRSTQRDPTRQGEANFGNAQTAKGYS